MALQITHLTPDLLSISNCFSVNWRAQTFTAPVTFDITSIKWTMGVGAGTPPDVTATINTLDGSNKPTTTILVSKTQAFSAGTPEFVFATTPTLTSGVGYAMVLSCPGGDGSNYVNLRGSDDSSYSGGGVTSSGDSGASWGVVETTLDYLFEVYGTAASVSDSRDARKLTTLGIG